MPDVSEPILYLHGFASSPRSNKAMWLNGRFRAAGREFLIPDLTPDFETMTIGSQLEVIRHAAGARPVAVMGSSLGGYLAALYAVREPSVTRVVLLAPAFDFSARWAARLGPEAMKDWRASNWLDVFHYGRNEQSRVGYALYEESKKYEPFPAVRQPALVIHGTRDEVVPVTLSREFAGRTPNARLVEKDSEHELTDVLEDIWEEASCFLGSS